MTKPIEPSDIDGEGGIFVTLAGHKFECRKVSVTWHMMKYAKAQRMAKLYIPDHLPKDHPDRVKAEEIVGAARMSLLETFHDILMHLMKPYERDRFEEFMQTADLEENELEEAIGDLISELGGAKKEVDEAGKAPTPSLPSSDSSKPNRTISRVPSSWEAMDEVA